MLSTKRNGSTLFMKLRGTLGQLVIFGNEKNSNLSVKYLINTKLIIYFNKLKNVIRFHILLHMTVM